MSRIEELYAQLQDLDDVDRTVDAIYLLESEATPDWLPTLHEWIARPGDFFLRESAAFAINRLEGAKCLCRLLEAMRLGTTEGHDNDTLDTIICDLVGSAPEEALPYLEELSHSSDPQDRCNAAWLLGYANRDSALPFLLALTGDPTPAVREVACGQLSSYVGVAVVTDCLQRCQSDPHKDVRVSAESAIKELSRSARRLAAQPKDEQDVPPNA
jgi:HEAT repeat protein